LNQKC